MVLINRAWRIEYEGALYHLLSRGNEGSDIFIDDYDRKGFLDAIEQMSERFEIDAFAYVLMSNITMYCSGPGVPIGKKQCTGSERLIRNASTGGIFEAGICFKVVIKALSYKMTPTCYSFPTIFIAIH